MNFQPQADWSYMNSTFTSALRDSPEDQQQPNTTVKNVEIQNPGKMDSAGESGQPRAREKILKSASDEHLKTATELSMMAVNLEEGGERSQGMGAKVSDNEGQRRRDDDKATERPVLGRQRTTEPNYALKTLGSLLDNTRLINKLNSGATKMKNKSWDRTWIIDLDKEIDEMLDVPQSGMKSILTSADGQLLKRSIDNQLFAQPPQFNYQRFADEFVPSDKMIKEMFPDNPVQRTAYRDAQTEYEMLNMFASWVEETRDFPSNILGDKQYKFHSRFLEELEVDRIDAGVEFDEIKQSLTDLQSWQKTYLDMDGELQGAKEKLGLGLNIFAGVGGREAKAKYRRLLEEMPRLPSDDIATWQQFHLGGNGTISKLQGKLSSLGRRLSSSYYGGLEAREKYLEVLERFINSTIIEIEDDLRRGKNVFRGFGGATYDAATSMFSFIIDRLPCPPEDDLATWERYHLNRGDGAPTLGVKLELRANDLVFDNSYFGGLQAREKWGYLAWESHWETRWEAHWHDEDGNQAVAEEGLRVDINILTPSDGEEYHSRSWAINSARAKYGSFLSDLPFLPKHDLKTWEWFHLDGDDDVSTKIKRLLASGQDPFQECYFGGVQARAKWGYLSWEEKRGSVDDFLERGLSFAGFDGGKVAEQGWDWEQASAIARFKRLIWSQPNPPKHDLETWERFNLYKDRLGTFRIKPNSGKDISRFYASYFGGVEARFKWGYLIWEKEHGLLSDHLRDGRDIFGTKMKWPLIAEWAEESAEAQWNIVLLRLEEPPKHDLETWERLQLDPDGVGTSNIESKLAAGKDVFGESYFGGVQARAKWGYLVWELSWSGGNKKENVAELAEARLRNGMDIFGWCPDGSYHNCLGPYWASGLGRSKYGYLLENLPQLPNHDLMTWEWFHLDTDGGCVKAKEKLKKGLPLFEGCYFGGIEARAKWGHLWWESLYGSLEDNLTTERDVRVLIGEPSNWAEETALRRWNALIEALPDPPKHDVKTWERFQLDEDCHGTTRIKEKLFAGENPFGEDYFGGIQARDKWGFLVWESAWLGDNGSIAAVEEELRRGRDVFAYFGHSIFFEPWVTGSARRNYGYLLSMSGRILKHDLATWESFHCRDGDVSAAAVELECGEWLFSNSYFGGVQARHKYGYLAPEYMREDWKREGRRYAQSPNAAGYNQDEIHRVPDFSPDLNLLFSDSWSWTSQPDLTEVFELLFAENGASKDQAHKMKPPKPSKPRWLNSAPSEKPKPIPPVQKSKPPKPAWLRDLPPRKLDTSRLAQKCKPKPTWLEEAVPKSPGNNSLTQKCKPPKPSWLDGVIGRKLETNTTAQKCKPKSAHQEDPVLWKYKTNSPAQKLKPPKRTWLSGALHKLETTPAQPTFKLAN